MWGSWGRRTSIAVTAALLSGCWLQPGYGPGHTRANPLEKTLTKANVTSLHQVWSAELAFPSDGTLEPVVAGGRVYISTIGMPANFGEVHARAIDAATGATVWDRLLASVPVPIESIRMPISVVGHELWTAYALIDFTTPADACVTLERLDLDDGSVIASESTALSGSGLVDAGDVVAQGIVGTCNFAGTSSLMVRDRTGQVQWTATVPEPLSGGTSTPAIAGGQIYLADGSRLFAYPAVGCGAPTCDATWSVDVGAAINRLQGPVAPTGASLVYVSGFDGGIWAIDRATGAVRWRADTGAVAVAVSGPTLYATSREAGGIIRVSAYDAGGCGAAACSPRWTSASLSGSLSTADANLAVAGGVVYVGGNGGVWAFDAAGCGSAVCDELVMVPVDGMASTLSVAEGRVFAIADDSVARTAHLVALAPS
jgi:outer membrane protein assembly factor BamB